MLAVFPIIPRVACSILLLLPCITAASNPSNALLFQSAHDGIHSMSSETTNKIIAFMQIDIEYIKVLSLSLFPLQFLLEFSPFVDAAFCELVIDFKTQIENLPNVNRN